MQCHYYLIESATGRDQWIVAAKDDDKAVALLPPEGEPYNIIAKTDPVDCELPFSARLRSWHGG